MYDLVEDKQFELQHVKTEDNTSDINSKNTKIEIYKKLADQLYNGLPIAEVKEGSSIKRKSDSAPSKEHVESSSAINTIVIDGSLSSLDANPSNPSGNPADDPVTMAPAMTPAKWIAYGRANTATVRESNTHERASCGHKMHIIASITTGRGTGIFGDSTNSTAVKTIQEETLVVDHNKRVEMSISERESV